MSRRYGREIKRAARSVMVARSVIIRLTGKDPNLFRVVLADLMSIDLRIDSVAARVSQNFQKIIERVGFLLSLAFLNHRAKQIIFGGINQAFAEFRGFQSFLPADGFESDGTKNLLGSSPFAELRKRCPVPQTKLASQRSTD